MLHVDLYWPLTNGVVYIGVQAAPHVKQTVGGRVRAFSLALAQSAARLLSDIVYTQTLYDYVQMYLS